MGRLFRTIGMGLTALAAFAPGAHAAVNFAPKTDYPAVPGADRIALGDFNGDRRPDVATTSRSSMSFSVLLGDGDGSFGSPINTLGTSGQSGIAAYDFDRDGDSDVVVIDESSDRATVFLSRGDGTFSAGVPYVVGDDPQDVLVAELNGDRNRDIVVASSTGDDVTILLGTETGAFAAGGTIPFSLGGVPVGVGAGDFDEEGDDDIAIGAMGGNMGWSENSGSFTGTFHPPVDLMASAQRLLVGEFTGDHNVDIAAGRSLEGDVVLLRRTGPRTFDAPVSFDPVPGAPANAIGLIGSGYLDGDETHDLVIPHLDGPESGRVFLAFGRGDGTFVLGSHEPVGSEPSETGVDDFNGDGNPDLVTANRGPGTVSVLLAEPPVASVTEALAFGTQAPNTESTVRTAVLRNNGPQRLRTSIAVLTGPDKDQFRVVSDTCNGANLGIGGECRIGVAFRPTGEGTRNASVAFYSNGAGTPHTVRLTGTGGIPVNPTGACANDLTGTSRSETLTGTAFGDNIFGRSGNDRLNGLAGNDCLIGERGNDRMDGGRGNDSIEGGSGRDVGSGGPGNDRMTGGSSRDRLSGGSGRDTLNGGSSHDRLSGGSGNDRLSGSSGNDRLTGSGGNDRLTGGSGRNTYSAGPGRDKINAVNRRVDRINCGSGRDTVRADRGDRLRACERVRRARR